MSVTIIKNIDDSLKEAKKAVSHLGTIMKSRKEVEKVTSANHAEEGIEKINEVRRAYRENWKLLEEAHDSGDTVKHNEYGKIERKLNSREKEIINKYFPSFNAIELRDRVCPVCEYDNVEVVEVCKCGVNIYEYNLKIYYNGDRKSAF